MTELAAWLYGTRVARLARGTEARPQWTWEPDAYDRWGARSRVVSHLLPVQRGGELAHPARVRVFLDGLLPEGNARTSAAVDAGVAPEDTWGLLRAYGRDTAGALVFQGMDEPAPAVTGRYERLDDSAVAELLRRVRTHLPAPDGSRLQSISLAGMVPKLGLHRDQQGWLRPLDGAPSTWILKVAHPASGPTGDVVDTEAYSLALARQLGLTTVTAEVIAPEGERAIAVSRYDRVVSRDRIERVHQEDLAQALGINTSDPTRKFQYGNALPNLRAAADVLRAGGQEPDELLRMVAFNVGIGNTDLHAKNISVLRLPDGSARLAPAYDVAMHLHHPGADPRLGFDVDGHTLFAEVDAASLEREGVGWGIPAGRARELVRRTLEQLGEALSASHRPDLPGVTDRAMTVVRTRVAALLASADPPVAARAGRASPPRRPGRRRAG